MRARELEVLANAVKSSNERLQACEIQKTGHTKIDLDHNVDGLDWNVIAEKVTTTCKIRRTADQCRIKWLGDRHPKFVHSGWSASEYENLKQLVAEQRETNDGKVDWVYVGEKLGGHRTPLDCMRHGVIRPRHVWTKEYDEKLYNAVQRYGTNNWSVVATVVSEDATAGQCQGRYFRALDPSLKKGAWSEAEFKRLEVAVKAYGNAWMDVAACMPGRTNEQCRERWMEHLATPSSQVQWTKQEDEILFESVQSMGNQWKAIGAKVGNGSTGSQCRLRYDKLVKQRALQGATSDVTLPVPTSRSAAVKELTVSGGKGKEKAKVVEGEGPRRSGKRGKGKEVEVDQQRGKKRKTGDSVLR